ncbi:MAG: helix-turn-helix transcriptional regulator [Actinomycetaceae bacterium]|nr:helix-turn-helix transcriptional regulator [Actinomycetaceae bacterium]
MAATSFASRLNEAFINAPWSLDRIVEMLAEQDLHISQATLSHWRTGRSVPKRHNSLRIVAALEEILGLTPQSLISLLRSYTEIHADNLAPSSETKPHHIDSSFNILFEDSDREMDWSNEIQRELLEGETIISSDFLTQTHTVVILARVPQKANPCLHVRIGLDETDVIPETGYVELFDIKGATIGERKLYNNGRTTVTRLDLPDSCYPGQLHRISYTYSYQSTIPFTEGLLQIFAWPLRFYVNRVEFEGKVPKHIEWVEETIREEDHKTYTSIATRPVVPIGNTIQICIENPASSRGQFRWE